MQMPSWLSAVLLCALTTSGCVASLDRAALRHERKAARLAALGDGADAAREQRRAENLRASAAAHDRRDSRFVNELLLR
jgi:hypothetical protein